MAKIFFVTGKSATGKDTIYKRLMDDCSLTLKKIVSYTTRPIRAGETSGEEYHFVTNAELEELKKSGKIIEQRSYNTVAGIWHYFTVNDGQFENPHANYLLIGTLEQYEQIRNYFGEESVVPIYIEVEAGLRLMRSIQREQQQMEPKYAEICRRFLADEADFSEENINRLGIKIRYENVDLEECLQNVTQDIKKQLI